MMMLAKQVLLLRDEQKWQINYESDDSKAMASSPGFPSVSTSLHGSLRYFYSRRPQLAWGKNLLSRAFDLESRII